MIEASTVRRLAAVVAADMAGFSRLVEQDEQGTLLRQKAYLREVIEPNFDSHHGRVVKTTGDGFIAEFSSVVDAIRCALDVQAEIARREAATPADRRISYRMGIELGEIVVDGDDIFGEGVNIAARLESIAEPGGICISAKVHSEIAGKLQLEFQDIGTPPLKNISRPIKVYRVRKAGRPPSEQLVMLDALLSKPAIAVLSFTNLGGDPGQDHFGDGLAEDIITMLSACRSFPVIARNSSFAYKGQAIDIRRIGRDLSARYLIEGSVRSSGNRVRISAQLVDAENGHHLWADKFDGSLDDVFAIQDDITRRIVAIVEPELRQAELRRSSRKRAWNPSAWELYLSGQSALGKFTPASVAEALRLFQAAIEADHEYADAHAGLSWAHQRELILEVSADRKQSEEEALRLARRAVEIDPGSSFAHLALSGAFIWANQHDLSLPETKLAVQLNPSNVHACLALGNRLDIVGDHEEGMAFMEKSLRLNPRDPYNPFYFIQLGRAYINARKYDAALTQLNEAVRRRPDMPHAYHVKAICLGHLGRIEEARAAAEACERIHPGFLTKRIHWNIYVDPAANRHLTEGLRKAGLA